MKRIAVLASLAAAGFALAACSSAVGPQAGHSTFSSPTKPVPAPTTTQDKAATDTHGLLIKQMGQWGGIGKDPQHDAMRWKITSIAPATCTTSYRQPPTNGHYLEVKGVVQVAANAQQGLLQDWPALRFGALDANSFATSDVQTGGTFSCLPHQQNWPQQIAPGTNYQADFVVDVPSAHGTLTLTSQLGPAQNGVRGWGWKY